MTIKNNNKSITVRFLLIGLMSCLFISPYFGSICSAQNNKNGIVMQFSKQNDSIKSNDLQFNVLKVWNNSTKSITGTINFTCPEQWKVISFSNEQTTILPGDTALIPLRVSPSGNASGGVAYIINATFKNKNVQSSANTYLTLPQLSKWEFSTNNGSAYFTETSPSTTFDIRLSNKGNTSELIKLQLQAGKLLAFTGNSNSSFTQYVDLKAFKDTVISHAVTFQTNLKYIDKLKYENNWRESAINVIASTDRTQKTSAIQIQKLNSIFYNQRIQNSSPLNFDYQLYNVMSNQELRNNLRIFGTLQFDNNREFQYLAGLQNFYFNGFSNIDISRQVIYNLRYTDNYNSIYAGYNVSGGLLHSINGRGISGTVKALKNSQFNYTLTQNPYSKLFGGVAGYTTTIKNISFNTEVVHEQAENGRYSANSGLIGTSFTLFKHHTLNLQLLGSQANYKTDGNQIPTRDTSVLGYTYRADYSMRYPKFDMRISVLNSQRNFIVNSGLQQIYLDGKYKLGPKTLLSLYGNRQLYAATNYPYNFDVPINYNSSDYLRLTSSFYLGKLMAQIGPSYNGSMRQNVNVLTGYKSVYSTHQPGVWASTTIKLNGYRSITPNITVSNIRFYYSSDDPNVNSYSHDKNVYYAAGINYFDNVWRVNAYYSSGSVSDLYRSVQVDNSMKVSRSIQVRPSYENYFFDRTVKLSAYVNYAYYMPSGRENTSYNLRYDQFLKGGWNFSVSGFMYANTRVDPDLGRISTKDINMVIGVSKSFNIQQPRQKYYDLKIIFYEDLDGNRIKTDNEPPVSNILVTIQKDQKVSQARSAIPEIKLLTDVNGVVEVVDLPKDTYQLNFEPLENLKSLYFLNGSEPSYFNDKERILYVPLAESFKAKGKVILVRDKNSTEGKIDLAGIRITGISEKGETYSTLTDKFGAYLLNVPNADKYKIHINNVFGEQFYIDANEVEVQFAQSKTINLDFVFIENKREIQFGNGEEMYKFSSIGNDSDSVSDSVSEPESVAVASTNSSSSSSSSSSGKTNQVAGNKAYSVQLGTSKLYKDPSTFKNKLNGNEEVFYTETAGVYKYYAGDFTTLNEANKAMKSAGIKGRVVAVDKSSLKKVQVQERLIVESVDQPIANESKASATRQLKNGQVRDTPIIESVDQSIANESKTSVARQSTIKNTEPQVLIAPKVDAVIVPKTASVIGKSTKSAKVLPIIVTPKVELATPKVVSTNGDQATNKIDGDEYLYTIQLDALRVKRDAQYYKRKYNLPFEVVCIEKAGTSKYYAGSYKTIENATADIARFGISGFIVPIEEMKVVK